MKFAINTISASSSTLTMSSRAIAELLECRHDSVKRTIERLAERGTIEIPPSVEIPTATKPVAEYRIGKRDSYVIVAQLSPEFTAALVDRWQALEDAAKPAFAIPQTFSAALLLAAKLEEERATLALENSKQAEVIAVAAPKAEFFDELVDTSEVYTPTQVANLLGLPSLKSAKKVNELMCKLGWQYKRGKRWFISALGISKGCLKSKVFTDADTGYSGCNVYITVEGLNALRTVA